MPDGLLFLAAGSIVRPLGVPGWIGRTENLLFLGELSSAHSENVLEIKVGPETLLQILKSSPETGQRRFSFQSPRPESDIPLQFMIGGASLMGSGARVPRDFDLDARTGADGNRLTGWAWIGWLPTLPLRLRFEDEEGARGFVSTERAVAADFRRPFSFDLQSAGFHGNRIEVSAQLPDGRWQPLPDSPLLLEPAVRHADGAAHMEPWAAVPPTTNLWPADEVARAGRVDVIIPVHDGLDATLVCIDAVLATLDAAAQLIVVDDATTDPGLIAALDGLAADRRIILLRNAANQGFVASVNRALALNPTHDAVLLNSDTQVFDDWLARLREAAYSGPTVGSATPLSNNASIASYPLPQGAPMEPEAAAALHALTASVHSGVRVEIPVGVGFCLYLRRDCLVDVGDLDAAVFGKGYGEETDFCLRARRRGWTHQLAADVFVYHVGGTSFGAQRGALLNRSQRLLNLRHPGYDDFIAGFLEQNPLHSVRRRLDEHRLAALGGDFVLLVSLALTGGVERFVEGRCRSLEAQGLIPLVLKSAEAGNSQRCALSTDAIEVPNLRYDIPSDLKDLSALLGSLPIASIEIQHFLHLNADVVDAVRALAVPYDVYVHDYSWICPRITLIDGRGRYCGEPAVAVCETCVSHHGSMLGEEISVAALRARSNAWLCGARTVIAPSMDTAARLQRHFKQLKVRVLPHAAPTPTPPRPHRPAGTALRIALIGAIGEHKGYNVLLECARDAQTRGLNVEYVVIGYTENDAPLLEIGNVFITGRYGEGELPHLLRREQPDMAWLPSVWPETWCYALDHALDAGLSVAAFDLGAIAERLRATGRGELMPLGLAANLINDRLLPMADGERMASEAVSRSEQTPLSRRHDDLNNAVTLSDEIPMREPPGKKSADAMAADAVREEGLAASVQVLPLAAGLYLFSVKHSRSTPVSGGGLSVPAMHVGLGPGIRSEQVEIMAGAATHGGWLIAAADLLVVKVNDGGATLIVTSVRAPGGDVLSIKVERLDTRADASAALRKDAVGAKHVAEPSVFGSAATDATLPIKVGAHIRTRGDMIFADVPWAGRVAPGLWIESFYLQPLEHLAENDIEYKALTGSGFETPWVSDAEMCGTKGMAVPLLGFALRLKPSAATAPYDCEYSGYFQSGATVGPLLNGAPCRSTVANDPLEGIQVRLLRRTERHDPPAARAAGRGGPSRQRLLSRGA
jgi:GT2 family glycosyltransferase